MEVEVLSWNKPLTMLEQLNLNITPVWSYFFLSGYTFRRTTNCLNNCVVPFFVVWINRTSSFMGTDISLSVMTMYSYKSKLNCFKCGLSASRSTSSWTNTWKIVSPLGSSWLLAGLIHHHYLVWVSQKTRHNWARFVIAVGFWLSQSMDSLEFDSAAWVLNMKFIFQEFKQ